MAASGGKGRRVVADDAPVEPLDEETLQRIRGLLQENDGAVPMGLISQKIPGVKKAHLQDHFELTLFENGKWEVRLPGSTAGVSLYMHGGKAISQPDAIPPLSDEEVRLIAEMLESSGGTASCDEVVALFPELKKHQLRELFEVRRKAIPGARGNPEAKRRETYEISLRPGQEYPGGIVGPPNPDLEELAGKGSNKGGKGAAKAAKGGKGGKGSKGWKGKDSAMAAAWASMCQQFWETWGDWSADDSWSDQQPPAKRQKHSGPIAPLSAKDKAGSSGNARIPSWTAPDASW